MESVPSNRPADVPEEHEPSESQVIATPDRGRDIEKRTCTVAVLVSSRRASLHRVLDAVYDQSYDKRLMKIVFAENSADGSLNLLREFQRRHQSEYEGITILESVVGIPQARNRCLAEAIGEFVLFIDDDVIAPSDTLQRVQRRFGTHASNALVGLPYLPSSGRSPLESLPRLHRLGMMPGMGCTGVRLDLLRDSGGFDESLPWGEDLDCVCRIKRAGHKVVILGPPYAKHLNTELQVIESRSVRSMFRNAWSSKEFDAKLLLRHKRHFFPVVARKYGSFVVFGLSLALLPVTWIPAVVATIAAWIVLQRTYSGPGRLYMPIFFAVSGLLSVVGLVRDLLKVSLKGTAAS